MDCNVPKYIPKAVVEYVNKQCSFQKSDNMISKNLQYSLIWNDQEVYILYNVYKYVHPKFLEGFKYTTSEIIIYNCQKVYPATAEVKAELSMIESKFPSFSELPHVCISD